MEEDEDVNNQAGSAIIEGSLERLSPDGHYERFQVDDDDYNSHDSDSNCSLEEDEGSLEEDEDDSIVEHEDNLVVSVGSAIIENSLVYLRPWRS